MQNCIVTGSKLRRLSGPVCSSCYATRNYHADTTWPARVAAAETLDELCAVLNEFEDARGNDETHEDHRIDLAGFPTFGGSAPADTHGVWAWDETRALYVAEDGSWYVDERTDTND